MATFPNFCENRMQTFVKDELKFKNKTSQRNCSPMILPPMQISSKRFKLTVYEKEIIGSGYHGLNEVLTIHQDGKFISRL